MLYLINLTVSLVFLRVGLCSLLLFYFQDVWRSVERRIESSRNGARWCGGPWIHLIFKSRTWLNLELTVSSRPFISGVITVDIPRIRWTSNQSRSLDEDPTNDRSDAPLHTIRRGYILNLHQRSNRCDLIAPFQSMDASSRPLIAMRLFIGRSRPNLPFKYIVLRDGKLCPLIFENFECPNTNSSANSISLCS